MGKIQEATGLRSPEIIAVEIKLIEGQTRQIMLTNASEIGKRLKEAKELVPHGSWGDWLKDHVDYSQSKANKYMQIHEKFSDLLNSDYNPNLTYTSALRLLTVPDEELEEVIEQTDAENVTARELEERIKALQAEKDDAEDRIAALEENIKSTEDDKAALEEKQIELERQLEDLKESGGSEEEMASVRAEMVEERNALLKQKQAADDKVAKLEKKVDQLKADQELIIEKEKEKAAAAAAETAKKESEDQITKLTESVDVVNKRLVDTEKKLAASGNESLLEFKIAVDHLQKEFNAAAGCIESMETEPAEKAKTALGTVMKKLIDQI